MKVKLVEPSLLWQEPTLISLPCALVYIFRVYPSIPYGRPYGSYDRPVRTDPYGYGMLCNGS